MRRTQPILSVRSLTLVLLIAGLALLAGGAAAQYERFKTRSLLLPERTDNGTWDGTYWYVNRDMRVALWLRTTEGVPELRLQLERPAGPEGFATDWSGAVSYETARGQGEFALRLTERDANTMKGTWDWNLQAGNSVRRQRGELLFYRAGTGREVVVHFNPFEFYIGLAGQERWQPTQQVWTFRKASMRLVRWEELPF